MVTIDQVVNLLYATALNPVVTGLGWILYNRMHTGRLAWDLKDTNKTTAIFFLLGLHFRLQEFLTRRALNNGVSDTYDWNREIVVVTGGAGGIGGEVVKKLSAKGTRIAVLDVLPLTFEKPANVEYFRCDLLQPDDLARAAKEIREKWGEPTVLCAIAGIVRGKGLLEATKRDLDLTFGVNTIALAMCYKEFVPSMVKKNHGHVVTMASSTAWVVLPQMADYAASKAAALALHEGLQSELRNIYNAPRVRCTIVCPGTVGTKMFAGLRSTSEFFMPTLRPEEVAEEIVQALWTGEARTLDLPWSPKVFFPSLRALPQWWRIMMQDTAKDTMGSFHGRQVLE